MELMTVLRAQLPLPSAPAPVEEASRTQPQGISPAVAPPQHPEALHPPRGSNAALSVRLAEIDEDGHPASNARAAAEAAREAYIRASLAAGISPLPLPGA